MSRLAVLVTAAATTAIVGSGGLREQIAAWHRMDVEWYVNIARYGYTSPLPGGQFAHGKAAFFPLLPMLMRALHPVVRDWVVAGLVISLVASAVACWALAVLVRREQGDADATYAVLLLVVSPFAVYLVAGYTESLFLALATTSWVTVQDRRWPAAGILAAAATLTRVTGLALALAILVHYLATRGNSSRTRARDLPWLALPFATLAAWMVILRVWTGHFDGFTRAEQTVWHRHLSSPVTALGRTLQAASDYFPSVFFGYWVFEIAAVALGVVLTVVFLRGRRFGWATYIGVTTTMLATSAPYASGSRAVLLWFPFFAFAGAWAAKRPRTTAILVTLSGALMLFYVSMFVRGEWVA